MTLSDGGGTPQGSALLRWWRVQRVDGLGGPVDELAGLVHGLSSFFIIFNRFTEVGISTV